MSPLTTRLAWMFGLLGLGASAESTYVHYRLLRDPLYTSVCDINTLFSCSHVYASRYASVASVPVALVGVLWFALVLLLIVGSWRSERLRENVSSYLFALSTVALAGVLYLAYASFVVLKTVCVFCVLTYVAVAGLFLVSGTASSQPMASMPARALNDLKRLATTPVALLVALLYLGGVASALAWFPRTTVTSGGEVEGPPPMQDIKTEFERFLDSEPRYFVPGVDAGRAKVLIVKFNDYQCPPCRQTHLMYKSILQKWEQLRPGEVKYVLKDYPIEGECNKYAPQGVHLAACEAAVAVRLARRHNRGSEMEEWLFAHQEELTPALVREAARETGLVEDFEAQYPRTLEEVKADIDVAARVGVESTPTFFINGLKIRGGLAAQFFDAAIAYELKKADQKK